MAIGSYDATPLDMAGAYTVFANDGVHLDPWMLASIRTSTGDMITDYSPDSKQVLDPRVAYLTVSMMENVLHRRDRHRHRRRRAQYGLLCSRRRQNRHQPRRLVRRIHLQSAVHCLGGQRRLHRHQYRRRARRRAHLGRVHEAAPSRCRSTPTPTNSSPPDGVEIVSIDSASNLLSDASCPRHMT